MVIFSLKINEISRVSVGNRRDWVGNRRKPVGNRRDRVGNRRFIHRLADSERKPSGFTKAKKLSNLLAYGLLD